MDAATLIVLSLELAIGVALARNSRLASEQKESLDEQKKIIVGVEDRLGLEFQRLEERIDRFLNQLESDIKESAGDNRRIGQSMQEAKARIISSLGAVERVLQDLRDINVNLLVGVKFKNKLLEYGVKDDEQ